MDLFWKIVLIADAVFLVLLIPFAIFRYEGDEEAGFVRKKNILYVYFEKSSKDCGARFVTHSGLLSSLLWLLV